MRCGCACGCAFVALQCMSAGGLWDDVVDAQTLVALEGEGKGRGYIPRSILVSRWSKRGGSQRLRRQSVVRVHTVVVFRLRWSFGRNNLGSGYCF